MPAPNVGGQYNFFDLNGPRIYHGACLWGIMSCVQGDSGNIAVGIDIIVAGT